MGGLIGRDDVAHVFGRSGAVEERPPVHWRRRAPRVHVGRESAQHFGAFEGHLTQYFGEQPVITDGCADAADFGVRDREVIALRLEVVR